MRRYHEELPRTRREHRLHLRWIHNWPREPVDCICDHQVGRFRKRRAIGCEKRRCFCKRYKLEPSTRDRRLRAAEAAALREYQDCEAERERT